MSATIAAAFKQFELVHRKASDSLEQGTENPANVRARLVLEAGSAFQQLDAKTRTAFAHSLLSNQLLAEITELQVQQALEQKDFSALVPVHSSQLLAYVRHARKRGLGFAAEAGEFSLVA